MKKVHVVHIIGEREFNVFSSWPKANQFAMAQKDKLGYVKYFTEFDGGNMRRDYVNTDGGLVMVLRTEAVQ